jgi:hypothetical protein
VSLSDTDHQDNMLRLFHPPKDDAPWALVADVVGRGETDSEQEAAARTAEAWPFPVVPYCHSIV